MKTSKNFLILAMGLGAIGIIIGGITMWNTLSKIIEP